MNMCSLNIFKVKIINEKEHCHILHTVVYQVSQKKGRYSLSKNNSNQIRTTPICECTTFCNLDISNSNNKNVY
jgi:hypothetical protein